MYLKPILEEFETALKHKVDGQERYYEIFKNPNIKEINEISYDVDENKIRGFMTSNGTLILVSPQEDLIHSTMLRILSAENILPFNSGWHIIKSGIYKKYIGVVLVDKKNWYLAESYGEDENNKIPDEYLEKYTQLFRKQGRTFHPYTEFEKS